LLVNVATPATVNLPATPTTNARFTVKDASGAASTNNITVSGNGHTIDGAATQVIATNFGAFTAIFNGTNWFIIA
jgi:hypothetical protein